jgi:hypothetical protein
VVNSREALTNLYAANTTDTFWQILVEPRISKAEWAAAVQAASSILPRDDLLISGNSDYIIPAILSEELFGPNHWQLSWSNRIYYTLKPLLPRRFRILFRKLYRRQQEVHFALGWPIEDRYVRFHFNCVANVLRRRKLDSVPYMSLWPHGHRFAFVLTHDVENEQGLACVRDIVDLEERMGFRSTFNFVPERYTVDHELLSSLRRRGFEIGMHDLKHDGKLFSSRQVFERRATRINQYLRIWKAVGFRAPYMHRNPEWLQSLNVEYDLSFFDTDPYEPMPGGTMSIWPFLLGSFVELPYTLVQDHTLVTILGKRTPRLWLDKVDFIEQWHGMALINTHPDYLREQNYLAIYEEFLNTMKERGNYWHALPRDVARWWRKRAEFQPQWRDGAWDLSGLPGATVSYFSLMEITDGCGEFVNAGGE